MQGWVIVFIGLGEGLGQLVGSIVYKNISFAWQCDVFNICVASGLLAIIILDQSTTSDEANKKAGSAQKIEGEEKYDAVDEIEMSSYQ